MRYNVNEINFIDATFRDSHQSLWAEGMTTAMILPVASRMDRIGFKAIEAAGSGHFVKVVRELREDPWERLRLISKKITETPLIMMMFHSITLFHLSPLSVLKLWLERTAANGIKRVQVIDAS